MPRRISFRIANSDAQLRKHKNAPAGKNQPGRDNFGSGDRSYPSDAACRSAATLERGPVDETSGPSAFGERRVTSAVV